MSRVVPSLENRVMQCVVPMLSDSSKNRGYHNIALACGTAGYPIATAWLLV